MKHYFLLFSILCSSYLNSSLNFSLISALEAKTTLEVKESLENIEKRPLAKSFPSFAESFYEYSFNPSLHLLNFVNLLDGFIYHTEQDLAMEGVSPLPFIHSYVECQSWWRGECGLRSGSNYPQLLRAPSDLSTLSVQQFGGSFTSYSLSNKGDYCLSPATIARGWVNSSGLEMSGKKNGKNQQLYYDEKEQKFTAIGGDGTIRHYPLYKNKNGQRTFLLAEEIQASGIRTYYESERNPKHGSAYQIYTTNKFGKMLRSLRKEVFNSQEGLCYRYSASNGRSVEYQLSLLQSSASGSRRYLQEARPSDQPPYRYIYAGIGQPSSAESQFPQINRLHQIVRPEGRFIQFEYDEHHQVREVYIPDSMGKPTKIYEIAYETDPLDLSQRYSTCLTDSAQLIKRYYFEANRVHRIEHDSIEDIAPIYRTELFLWDQDPKSPYCGNLLGKALQDGLGQVWGTWNYRYDRHHNVIEEQISGNLSGKAPENLTFKQPSSGPIRHLELTDGFETFSKFYSYSDSNLKLSEREEGGPLILYSYYLQSDLLKSKLTVEEGRIIRREFFAYNDDTALIRHVVDDGSGNEEEDLSDVSERKIQLIAVQEDPQAPGFSLPKKVVEAYLDLESGKIVSLKEERFTYQSGDRLRQKEIVDALGQLQYSLKYSYGNLGELLQESDPLGRITEYRYDANKNCIRSELIGSGFYVQRSFDFNNRLIVEEEVHPEATFKKQFTYDHLGRKNSYTDEFGQTTDYLYDSLGRLIEERRPLAQLKLDASQQTRPTFSKRYNSANHVEAEIDANGAEVLKSYNFYGQPTRIVDPLGGEERFEYYLNGTLACHFHKNGTFTCYTYDCFKRVTSIVHYTQDGAPFSSQKQTYNAFHLTQKVDELGCETLYFYDGAGRLIEEIQKDGEKSRKRTYSYDALSRLYETKIWYGQEADAYIATSETFDSLNRVIKRQVVDGLGNGSGNGLGTLQRLEAYRYDFNGNRCEHRLYDREDHFSLSTTIYNTRGDLITEVDALGNEVHYSYDYRHKNALGQQVLKKTRSDPLGNQTIEIFDALGRLVFKEKKNSFNVAVSSLSIVRDLNGNPVLEEHVKNDVTLNASLLNEAKGNYRLKQTYDALGRIVKVTEQSLSKSKQTEHLYNIKGELATTIKPDGVQLSHVYDCSGYLSELTSSDNSIHHRYTYDPCGNLLLFEDVQAPLIQKRTFDRFNQLIAEELGNGLQIAYAYDIAGRLHLLTLPDGSKVRYCYQGANLIAVERLDSEENSKALHRYQSFDLTGFAQELILPHKGGCAQLQSDAIGRLRALISPLFSFHIPDNGYDRAGNLRQMTISDQLGTQHYSFSYDDLYQLQEEKGPFNHRYRFDSLHNRLECDGRSWQVDELNRTTATDQAFYLYDANGNQLQKERKENKEALLFTYDALNRLKSVEEKESIKVLYSYDSFGRRLQKSHFAWNLEKKEWLNTRDEAFLYQGEKEMGAYLLGHPLILRLFGSGRGADFGSTLFIERDGHLYSPLCDQRGNISALIDSASGEVAEYYRTSSFGLRQAFSADGEEREEVISPWGFAGKRHDIESNLIYFGKRYYDPELGKWLTPDPLGFADGPNLYAFIRNRPFYFLDFYGLNAESLQASSFLNQGLTLAGSYLEWGARNVLYSSSIQYNLEGVGRWMQGLSFQHQASWEIGSVSGRIEGPSFSTARVRYVPGIGTTLESCEQRAREISNLLQGHEVFFTCHQTQGLLTDSINAGAYKVCGWLFEIVGAPTLTDRAVVHLAKDIEQDFASKEASAPYTEYIIAHSRGGLETDSASALLPKALQRQIALSTLGSFDLAKAQDYKSAINYLNPHDIVPKLDFTAYFSAKEYNNVNTHYSSSWSLWRGISDHMLDSEGYSSSLKKISARILNEEGR